MSIEQESLLYTEIESPIGRLLLAGDGDSLHRLHMLDAPRPTAAQSGWRRAPDAFADVEQQLAEYFDGERTSFEVPLQMRGTPFQRSVWEELTRIGYGETASYGEIAQRVGQPAAARAVGITNARNPIAVIVPCHRVIGANGTLTGYGGGLQRKRFLLELEQEAIQPRLAQPDAQRSSPPGRR